MKILFLDTIYPSILEDKGFFDLPEKGDSYQDQALNLDNQKFSAGSMYRPGLVARSNQVEVIYANARKPQLLWGGRLYSGPLASHYSWKYWQHISRIPFVGGFLHERSLSAKVVMNQIRAFEPSVVYVLNINFLSKGMLKTIKKMGIFVVGQVASPLPPLRFYKFYDHMFSAHPGQVEHFKSVGVSSSWLPLAFDAAQRASFEQHGWPERTRDVTFVGTFGKHQRNTGPLLKAISREVPGLQIFTLSKLKQLKRFGLLSFFRGRAWGPEMYKILAESKIVVNRHGAVADGYSVNFRMFEATGMGALLVTEQGKNTSDLFEPGKEVLTYTSIPDAVNVIKSALADFESHTAIASAGQRRALTEHTYEQRAIEIDRVLRNLVVSSPNSVRRQENGIGGAGE